LSAHQCGCGRPMPGNRTICGACQSDLARALQDLPFYAAHLQVAYARLGVLGDNGGRRASETAIPFHSPAARMAAALHTTITRWADTIPIATPPSEGPTCWAWCRHKTCTAVRRSRPPGPRDADKARWLHLHIDHIPKRPDAWIMACDITAITRAAERVIDRPADLTYAGPCDHCGADLYARLGTPLVYCRMCQARYDVQARRAWLLNAVEDTLANATMIARALTSLGRPVTPERIWKWKERGLIIPHSHRAAGGRQIPLFRIGDVLDLLARMSAARQPGPDKVAS
jgi:hypothetical protein